MRGGGGGRGDVGVSVGGNGGSGRWRQVPWGVSWMVHLYVGVASLCQVWYTFLCLDGISFYVWVPSVGEGEWCPVAAAAARGGASCSVGVAAATGAGHLSRSRRHLATAPELVSALQQREGWRALVWNALGCPRAEAVRVTCRNCPSHVQKLSESRAETV